MLKILNVPKLSDVNEADYDKVKIRHKTIQAIKPIQILDADYIKIFPKSINYIVNSIFHLEKNCYVLKSTKSDGSVYFKD